MPTTKTTEPMAETTRAKRAATTTTHVTDHPKVAHVETFTKHDVNCACSRFTEKKFTSTIIAIMIMHFLL